MTWGSDKMKKHPRINVCQATKSRLDDLRPIMRERIEMEVKKENFGSYSNIISKLLRFSEITRPINTYRNERLKIEVFREFIDDISVNEIENGGMDDANEDYTSIRVWYVIKEDLERLGMDRVDPSTSQKKWNEINGKRVYYDTNPTIIQESRTIDEVINDLIDLYLEYSPYLDEIDEIEVKLRALMFSNGDEVKKWVERRIENDPIMSTITLSDWEWKQKRKRLRQKARNRQEEDDDGLETEAKKEMEMNKREMFLEGEMSMSITDWA